jgi:hypothetical protein
MKRYLLAVLLCLLPLGCALAQDATRGALGQFIFMVPDLDVAAVFTSYGTRKPSALLDRVVLPACAGKRS